VTGRRTWTGVLVAALLALAVWWFQDPGPADDPATPGPGSGGLPVVALADLPPEAAETVELVDAGGPFPHEQDDGTFFNREELLPERAEGYYREYTVETPGSEDRGGRRIVAGGGGELYWTDDHYASFSLIER
jgi:ribonuclease T1